MLSALAFALWSTIQPVPGELGHLTYSSGQTLGAWWYGFRSHEVTVDDCTTRYLEQGNGPTLVLLHGAGVSKEVWLPMVSHFSNHYRIIIPDLPGHGQSCKDPDRNYRIEGFSQWFREFSTGVQLGQFHLVGHSVGAAVGVFFASDNPNEVLSITALAPAGIERVPAHMPELTPFMQELVQTGQNQLLVESTSDFTRVVRMSMHSEPPAWLSWASSPFLAWEYMRNQEYLEKVVNGVLKTRQDIQDGLIDLSHVIGGIHVPAQVIWGEEDNIMHVAGAGILEGQQPDLTVYRLPAIGHTSMVEAPQPVAELVEQLVESVEKR